MSATARFRRHRLEERRQDDAGRAAGGGVRAARLARVDHQARPSRRRHRPAGHAIPTVIARPVPARWRWSAAGATPSCARQAEPTLGRGAGAAGAGGSRPDRGLQARTAPQDRGARLAEAEPLAPGDPTIVAIAADVTPADERLAVVPARRHCRHRRLHRGDRRPTLRPQGRTPRAASAAGRMCRPSVRQKAPPA